MSMSEFDRQAGEQTGFDPASIDPEMLALITRMREAAQRDPARQRDVEIGEFTVDGARVPLSLVEPLKGLTRTEVAALRFAGWGRSNADIATLLAIGEGTVRTHLNNAVRKLDLDGMRGLVALGGLLFHSLD